MSTTTTHTPGQWTLVVQPPEPHPLITVCARQQPVCDLYRGYDKTKEVIYADARLIAAAPDLLEALKAFVDWHGGAHEDGCPEDDTCGCDGYPVNQLVNAAIAKAEGR